MIYRTPFSELHHAFQQAPPGARFHCFILALAMLVGGKASRLHLTSHLLISIPVSSHNSPLLHIWIISPELHGCNINKQDWWQQLNCHLFNKTYSSKRTSTVLLHLVHSHNIEMTCQNQYKILICFKPQNSPQSHTTNFPEL